MSKMIRLIYIFVLTLLARPGSFYTATNKLSLASWGSYNYREHKGPGTYAYGFDIEDPVTGNVQFRQEERHSNGTITGSYGYVDANGVPQVTNYISDVNGYRIIDNKPGVFEHVPHNDNHALTSLPFGHSKTDKIYNPPPLIYELAVNVPIQKYNPNYLVPIPYLYKGK